MSTRKPTSAIASTGSWRLIPLDPASTPVKHTALGRFRHEGAEMIVNKDGRVVVYSGDDSQFDYVYRFVSKETYQPGDKAAQHAPAVRRHAVGRALQ